MYHYQCLWNSFNNKNTHAHTHMHAIKVRSIFLLGLYMGWVKGAERARGSKKKQTERERKLTKKLTLQWHKRQRAFTLFGIYLLVYTVHRWFIFFDQYISEMWFNVCRIKLTLPYVRACKRVREHIHTHKCSHPHTIRANWLKRDANVRDVSNPYPFNICFIHFLKVMLACDDYHMPLVPLQPYSYIEIDAHFWGL